MAEIPGVPRTPPMLHIGRRLAGVVITNVTSNKGIGEVPAQSFSTYLLDVLRLLRLQTYCKPQGHAAAAVRGSCKPIASFKEGCKPIANLREPQTYCAFPGRARLQAYCRPCYGQWGAEVLARAATTEALWQASRKT